MEIKNFNNAHDLNAILNQAYDAGQRVRLAGEFAVAVYDKPTTVFGRLANWFRNISGANRREHEQVVSEFQRLVDLVRDVHAQDPSASLRERAPSVSEPNTLEASRSNLAVSNGEQVAAPTIAAPQITVALESPDKSAQPIKLGDQVKNDLHIDAPYLQRLDKSIAEIQKTIGTPDSIYTYILTTEFAPALVALENLKKPDLHLQYCDNTTEFRDAIKDCIEKKTPNARFLVRYEAEENRGVHVAYFDYQLRNDVPSVLQLDSAAYSNRQPGFMLFTAKSALESLDPKLQFAGLEVNIQKSNTECPIFALNTAKQMYKNPTGLDHIHELNCKGVLVGKRSVEVPDAQTQHHVDETAPPDSVKQSQGKVRNDYLDAEPAPVKLVKRRSAENPFVKPYRNVDELLPPTLLKHSQSKTRNSDYFSLQPGAEPLPVNQKGETLAQYQDKHGIKLTPTSQNKVSGSIFQKRLEYLQELRTALQ